jgi:hypothetical protein
MKIKDTAIRLYSSQSQAETAYSEESFRFWTGTKPENNVNQPADIFSISTRAADLIEFAKPDNNSMLTEKKSDSITDSINETDDSGLDNKQKVALKLIEMMFEQLTGKKLNLSDTIIKMKKAFEEINTENAEYSKAINKNNPQQASEPAWGAEYSKREIQYRSEFTSFQAEGIINTADGKSISFNLSFELSQEFMKENNIDIQMGNAVKKDPLVLNFDGTSAELSDSRFDFDLDADGTNENIPFVKTGSGFLVLDKNKDGKVNDGSELFGPWTGNGFNELKTLDSDNNDWIDQNDSSYGSLSIWEKTANNADKLTSLKDKNVGAIYLKSTATPYTIYDGTGKAGAEKASTGIFLTDSGSVSTIEQMNILV